jgi:hypothetical protein
MRATTLSFRAGEDFAEQTRALANVVGLKSSDATSAKRFARKNGNDGTTHCNTLKELSTEHLAFNESLEGRSRWPRLMFLRGQVWEADFELQTHKQARKRNRPTS